MLLIQFWNDIKDSQISFIADNERTQSMIESYIGVMTIEIEKGKKQGRSTYKYFDLLEEITYELIKIHGFEAFANIYAEEKGWIKTEIKNTLNFAFMSKQLFFKNISDRNIKPFDNRLC